MEYIAILKDGGLFIPNILTDLENSHTSIFKVPLDIQSLREQAKNKVLLEENAIENELKKLIWQIFLLVRLKISKIPLSGKKSYGKNGNDGFCF